MIVEYQRAGMEGSLKRRNDDGINLDIFHCELCFLALIDPILGDFGIEMVLAELISDVLFSIFEHFESEFLLELSINLVSL